MRILTVSIVIAPLLLVGALPAAGQSTLARGMGAHVRMAAGGDATADRDTYLEKARDEMREWQRKLHDFGEEAEAKGKDASDAAENDLKKAWSKTEAESDKLRTASAEGWESARSSFEKASHELAEVWHKLHGEDK
jgi:hypothetical protein